MLPARNGARLLYIAPEQVEALWPHVHYLIEHSIFRSQSDYTIDNIRTRINDGTARLWIIWNEKKPELIAAATTELQLLPDGRRVLVIAQLAGRDVNRMKRDFFPDLVRYARDEKCSAVRCYGRRGWSRYLKDIGFEEVWMCTERPL